jgi:hypothetical protein
METQPLFPEITGSLFPDSEAGDEHRNLFGELPLPVAKDVQLTEGVLRTRILELIGHAQSHGLSVDEMAQLLSLTTESVMHAMKELQRGGRIRKNGDRRSMFGRRRQPVWVTR